MSQFKRHILLSGCLGIEQGYKHTQVINRGNDFLILKPPNITSILDETITKRTGLYEKKWTFE